MCQKTTSEAGNNKGASDVVFNEQQCKELGEKSSIFPTYPPATVFLTCE